MIQILLQGMKMDPLVSLHYYAPVNLPSPVSLLYAEPYQSRSGLRRDQLACPSLRRRFRALPPSNVDELLDLPLQCQYSVPLNVAAVFLIGVGSGLILTLAGVFK